MRTFSIVSTYIVFLYVIYRAVYKIYLFRKDKDVRLALILFCIYMMVRIWRCY